MATKNTLVPAKRTRKTDLSRVVIRKARKADLRRVAEIESEIYLVEGPWPYEDFVTDFSTPGRYYLVATYQDEIVGYSACIIAKNSGQLTMNTVLPGWRGHGIGKSMLEKRLAWLDKRVNTIELQTHRHNELIQKGYLKYGFVPTKVLKNYYGKGVDAQEMRRKLPKETAKTITTNLVV